MPCCDPPVDPVPDWIRSSASVCIYGCIHSYYSFFLLFKDKNNEIMAMVKSDLIHKRLNGKALREYKQTITLSQIQREMLVGTLLGDASIPFRKGKSTLSVKFTQTLSRAEYIQQTFLKTLWAHPRECRRFVICGEVKRGDYQSIRFRTFCHLWST